MIRKQKIAILIPLLFIVGLLISKLVQNFRFKVDFRWVYEFGSILGLAITFSTFFWSLIYSIIYIRENKINLNKELIWLFIGAIPFTYISICFLLIILYL
jgi:hypothetical protein